jgi:glutamate racemase
MAKACPLFVPFVEEGWLSGKVVAQVAKTYLKPLRDAGVDTVILGCTHYPLLKAVIKEALGKDVTLIDSAQQVAIEVKEILSAEGLLSKARRGRHRFYVSDNPEGFSALAKRFLDRDINNISKVNSNL